MRARAGQQRSLPRDSKTIPLRGNDIRGDGRDHGKYYRCWNCGFVCDVERDELGGPDSRHGVTATEYTQVDQYGNTSYHCVGAHGDTQTVCEANGGAWSSTRYKPVVGSGCSFCGTKNYRGDY